jgi:hypothetical protein
MGTPDSSWVVDRALIQELTATYNRCADLRDGEGYAGTFTEEGSVELVGWHSVSGRAALRKMMDDGAAAGNSTSRFAKQMHVTTDAIIRVDGDKARQDASVTVFQQPEAGKPLEDTGIPVVFTGRYKDELVRTAEGWRFEHRRIILHTRSEDEHLRQSLLS